MKLTVVVAICLVLCLNYELSSSQPLKRIKPKNFIAYSDGIQARQAYPAEDDYYDEEEDEEEEDELQQSLNEQNYDGNAGGQGEGQYGGQEPEEEDDNEEDEGDEDGEGDDEERFMENNAFLTKIFDIL